MTVAKRGALPVGGPLGSRDRHPGNHGHATPL